MLSDICYKYWYILFKSTFLGEALALESYLPHTSTGQVVKWEMGGGGGGNGALGRGQLRN